MMNFKNMLLVLVTGVSLIANAQMPPPPVAPTVPVMENCAPTDTACTTRNQLVAQQHQNALASYQTQQQQYSAYQQTLLQQQAAAAAAAARAQEAALASAKLAEKQNKGGSDAYGMSKIINMAVGGALMAVCSTPTGQWACMPAAFFLMQGSNAAGQENAHQASQSNACQVANQISTNPTACASMPAPYDPGGFPTNSIGGLTDNFDPNGNCIGTQAQCQAVLDNLPPGTNIRNTMDGLSQFASGKGPFTMNSDGTVKLKNGKNLGLSAFNDKKAMMDAGMSAAQADQMLAMMAKQKALGELNAQKALAKENEFGNGDAMAGATMNGTKSDGAANGDATGGLGKNTGDRNLASEGLTKDFNGELIGARGDDIFKMMNRRYRLKASQDSFITAAP